MALLRVGDTSRDPTDYNRPAVTSTTANDGKASRLFRVMHGELRSIFRCPYTGTDECMPKGRNIRGDKRVLPVLEVIAKCTCRKSMNLPLAGTLQKHEVPNPTAGADAHAKGQKDDIVIANERRPDAQRATVTALRAKKQSVIAETPKQFTRAEIEGKIICVRCKADIDAKHPETAALVAKTRDAAPYENFYGKAICSDTFHYKWEHIQELCPHATQAERDAVTPLLTAAYKNGWSRLAGRCSVPTVQNVLHKHIRPRPGGRKHRTACRYCQAPQVDFGPSSAIVRRKLDHLHKCKAAPLRVQVAADGYLHARMEKYGQ